MMIFHSNYELKTENPIQKKQVQSLHIAAEIICQDIRSAVCEVDNYPPSIELFFDVNDSLRMSLLFLMEETDLINTKEAI